MGEKQHIMMRGTDGGYDYLLFARRGTIGLGIKPLGIMPASVPNTTFIGLRLRSAYLPKEVVDQLDQGVTKLTPKLTIAEAWPHVKWDDGKVNHERASSVVCVFEEGSPQTNPAMIVDLIKEKDFGGKLVEHLVSLCGDEHLTMDQGDMLDWFNDFYLEQGEAIRLAVLGKQKVDAGVKSNLGIFGMQADLLKKFQVDEPTVEDEDAPDVGQDDQSGAYDPNDFDPGNSGEE